MSPKSTTPPARMETASPPKWEAVLDRVRTAMGAAEYVQLNPAQLRPLPGQPREYFNESDLTELSESIVRVGQFQPGIVRASNTIGGTDHEILDGERRWRAIVLGGVKIYKAMLVEVDDEAAPFVVASIANFNRQGHTHMEISNAIARLYDQLEMPIEVVAKMYNLSAFWARELYGLQKLDPQIQSLIDPRLPKDQRLAVTVAIHVSKLERPVQSQLVRMYRDKEVTVSGLRKRALQIAEQTGTHIRKREFKQPARIASRVERLTGSLERTATDLSDTLKETAVTMALRGNLPAAYRARRSLERVTKLCEEANGIITSLRNEELRPIVKTTTPDPVTTGNTAVAKNFAAFHNNQVSGKSGQPAAVKTPPPPIHPSRTPVRKPVVRPEPAATPRFVAAPVPEPMPKPVLSEDERRWGKGITVNRWDNRAGRITMTEVTPQEFLALWDKGELDFQVHGKKKPDHLPSREQIAALVEKLGR